MNIYNENKLYKLLKFVCVYMFFINFALAQEDTSKESVKINNTFPIAVVNMQAIVGGSTAAVKVKEFIEAMKIEFSAELHKEEGELKSMQ